MKRGQISVFVIISVFILIIILIYFLISKEEISERKVDAEIQPLYSFVEECLKNSGEEALFHITSVNCPFKSVPSQKAAQL